MYSFSELLKKIRVEGSLTQPELAKLLGVSPITVSMIEANQKEAGKNFIKKLAELLDVDPSTIIPFVFERSQGKSQRLSQIEKKLYEVGLEMQNYLITVKARRLKKPK